jgi:preprotein translocase subunit Sec63
LYAFKLNPYEQLNLRFTATPEEIRKQYRKISLMVHPDKCKHEKASEAFEGELRGVMAPQQTSRCLMQYSKQTNTACTHGHPA